MRFVVFNHPVSDWYTQDFLSCLTADVFLQTVLILVLKNMALHFLQLHLIPLLSLLLVTRLFLYNNPVSFR